MDELSICLYPLNANMDMVETTLSKHFKTFKVHSESELKTLLKNEHIFCIVVGCNIRENTELLKIRKLLAAFARTPTLVYAKVHEPEVGFQLGKSGLDEFIPNPNLDLLLEKLHRLKEQATFRIDLREFGIDLNQCKNYWTRKFFDFILKDFNFLKYRRVNEIADKLNISLITLEHAFKKDCWISPKQILLCLQNYYAAYLLTISNMPVKSIAQKCRFINEQVFSKCFKNSIGLTPKYFRLNFNWNEYPSLFHTQYKTKNEECQQTNEI